MIIFILHWIAFYRSLSYFYDFIYLLFEFLVQLVFFYEAIHQILSKSRGIDDWKQISNILIVDFNR